MLGINLLFEVGVKALKSERDEVFFNWDSLHARLKQPLRVMELQEKEAQKD